MRTGFSADHAVLVLFAAPEVPGNAEPSRFFRTIHRDDEALQPFSTFLESSAPRCGQARDAQLEFMYIAAPHTSNWDGIWGLIAKVAFDVDVRFFGKESLFWFPLGVLLRGMGGIPLDRSRAGGTVAQAIEAFATEEKLNIAMAPEGTRSFREHWKSGFYRIAVGAGVPLGLAFFDYDNRRIGLGPTLDLTGRPDEDMIVDDVITAGTAVREAYQIITQAGAEIAGLTISLDREERGQGSVSAVQELKGSLGFPVVSIAGLGDLVEILEESGEYEAWLEPVVRYRRQYGVMT